MKSEKHSRRYQYCPARRKVPTLLRKHYAQLPVQIAMMSFKGTIEFSMMLMLGKELLSGL
jgi:hypothetical protein